MSSKRKSDHQPCATLKIVTSEFITFVTYTSKKTYIVNLEKGHSRELLNPCQPPRHIPVAVSSRTLRRVKYWSTGYRSEFEAKYTRISMVAHWQRDSLGKLSVPPRRVGGGSVGANPNIDKTVGVSAVHRTMCICKAEANGLKGDEHALEHAR